MATALAANVDTDSVNDPIHHSISRPGTERLGAEIAELSARIYAASYRLLVLIRAFDEQQGWHQYGLRSCAHWLNFKCGTGLNAAREKVRVAHALKDLPTISAAFERGEVSFSKVRAMTRIANADNEDYLLTIARHGTAWHVEQLVRKYRRAKRLQDIDVAAAHLRERFLDYRYDEDGCLIIRARLPAEQGAMLLKALQKAKDDEFVDNAARASDVTAETSTPETTAEAEPVAARRADALSALAESYLRHGAGEGSGGDRYQLVVHVSAKTPRTDEALGDARIEDGPHVTAETSRRIACDCSVVPIWENARHEPLAIGRKTRAIPPAIRRALKIRDGGCRFPGCTQTRFVDGHHVDHWADGGETSLDNLVLLCRHHHRLVHEGGYDCRRATDGEIYFTAPDKVRLPEYVPLPPIEEDAYHWFERVLAGEHIDPMTCVPDWYAGDRVDWHDAVSLLFLTEQTTFEE